MIMGSSDRIATGTTHDHGVPSPKGGPKGGAALLLEQDLARLIPGTAEYLFQEDKKNGPARRGGQERQGPVDQA